MMLIDPSLLTGGMKRAGTCARHLHGGEANHDHSSFRTAAGGRLWSILCTAPTTHSTVFSYPFHRFEARCKFQVRLS